MHIVDHDLGGDIRSRCIDNVDDPANPNT